MGINRYLIFALLALASLLSVMQFSMISITLPAIIDDLDAPLNQTGWVITIYMLAPAISLPLMGKLSDRLGSRTLFASGLTVFALASLAGALAPNVYILIAARGVQGLASGAISPSVFAIIGDTFRAERARAIGFMGSLGPAGTILGPNLGGVIVEHLGWRWTLGINVPSGLLIVAIAFLLIRPSAPREAGRIDFVTVGFLALGMSSLVYALTELGHRGGSPNLLVVFLGLALAVIGAAAFLRRESRAGDPLLDRSLFQRRDFFFVYAFSFLHGVIIFGAFSFVPLYVQTAYGMSTSDSATLLTFRAVSMIAGSATASLLLPYTAYRKPITAGLLGMAAVLLTMSLGLHDPQVGGIQLSNFLYMAILIALTGGTFGVLGPASSNAGIDLAPDRIAAIAGLRSMFTFLGGTIGTAVIVLVTSRASSEASGLELSFLGLAVLSCLTVLLVPGIPEMARRRRSAPGAAPTAQEMALALKAEDGE